MAGKRASSRTKLTRKLNTVSKRSDNRKNNAVVTPIYPPGRIRPNAKRSPRHTDLNQRRRVATKRPLSPDNSPNDLLPFPKPVPSHYSQSSCRSDNKRKRVAENQVDSSYSDQCLRSGTRHNVVDLEGDVFRFESQSLTRNPFFPTDQEPTPPFDNQWIGQTNTGSCNSKRRLKGHAGGVSTAEIHYTDQPHSLDSEICLPKLTTPIVTRNMPADFTDQSQKPTTTTKILPRTTHPRRENDVPGASTSGSTTNWFRSFTCFSTSTVGEQVPIDLTGPSSSSNNVSSSAAASGSACVQTGGMVLTSSVQSVPTNSTVSHGAKQERSHGDDDATAVFRLAASSTTSTRQRGHRESASKAFNTASAAAASSTTSGVKRGASSRSGGFGSLFSAHHHHGHTHSHGLQTQLQQQSSSINQCIFQLQQNLGDLDTQLALLQEINQMLLMGSEESLAGIGVRNLVSVILELLDTDESIATSITGDSMVEMKNLCCNVLAHLMDVLPKAADAVVMAVPLLLNTMSCSFVGDILERIINVLEQISRRHGRQILLYGGVTVVMGYYDFVTVSQHRTILAMVANCFTNVRPEDFDAHIAGCLPSLCERLAPTSTSEPRCIGRVCLCFARLVEAFRGEPEKLRQIASFGLCQNLQLLISASPPIISNVKDIAYMLANLCTSCPDLSMDLLKLGYTETLYTLLTDQKPHEFGAPPPTDGGAPTAFVKPTALMCTSSRSNIARALDNRGLDNTCALLQLISALLPSTPTNFLQSLPTRSAPNYVAEKTDIRAAIFQQQCKMFEDALAYYHTQRIPTKHHKTKPLHAGDDSAPTSFTNEVSKLFFVKTTHILLPMLFDLYAELNGISPRLRCIEAIQRMVYHSGSACISYTVSPRSVSSMVSGMLGSTEFVIIAAGLHLAKLFITRIPLVFSTYFRKEGVIFHLRRLASLTLAPPPPPQQQHSNFCDDKLAPNGEASSSSSSSSTSQVFFPTSAGSTYLQPITQIPAYSHKGIAPIDRRCHRPSNSVDGVSTVSAQSIRLRSHRGRPKAKIESPSASFEPPSISPNSSSSTATSYSSGDANILAYTTAEMDSSESPLSRTSSTSTLDMDRGTVPCGASVIALVSEPSKMLPSPLLGIANAPDSGYRDGDLRAWIASQCDDLVGRIEALVPTDCHDNHHQHHPVERRTLAAKAAAKKALQRPAASFAAPAAARDLVPELETTNRQLLCPDDPVAWTSGLCQLASMLLKADDEAPSPFEVQHSGLLKAMQAYLTSSTERRLRIYLLLRVFVGPRITKNINLKLICDSHYSYEAATKAIESLCNSDIQQKQAFPYLINCLLNCLHQQEHFQVLVGPSSYLAGSSGHGSHATEEMLLTALGGGGAGGSLTPSSASGSIYNRQDEDDNSGSGVGGEGGSKSRRFKPPHSDAVAGGRGCHPLLPRQWANLVPGFLKLELIRNNSSSEEQQTSTSNVNSRKSTSDTSSLIKNTFWESAPLSIPLHVNALITAQNLQRILIQRSFLASLVSTSADELGRQEDGGFITPPSGTAAAATTLETSNQPSSHQQRRLCRRHCVVNGSHSNSHSNDGAGGEEVQQPGSSMPYNLRHEKTSAAVARSNPLVEQGDQSDAVSHVISRSVLTKPRENYSRPKNLSLMAAFGMLQFSSHDSLQTTTSPEPDAAQPPPSASSRHRIFSSSSSSAAVSASSSKDKRDGRNHISSRHLHRNSASLPQQPAGSGHSRCSNELLEATAAAVGTMGSGHLSTSVVPVFYVNGRRICDQMPLYQAVRLHSPDIAERRRGLLKDYRFSMTEQNREDVINTFMWRNVHTVHYRLEKVRSSNQDNWFGHSPSQADSSSRPFPFLKSFGVGGGSSSSNSTKTAATTGAPSTSPLSAAISCLKRSRASHQDQIPTSVDSAAGARILPYLEPIPESNSPLCECHNLTITLSVLRALHGLSEVANTLDELIEPFPITPANNFQSQKLSVKASRQLQDIFCVLAGNLPEWLVDMVTVCPFLFPFSVRQTFFYVHNFDRDRAILHMQDSFVHSSNDVGGAADGGFDGEASLAVDAAFPTPSSAIVVTAAASSNSTPQLLLLQPHPFPRQPSRGSGRPPIARHGGQHHPRRSTAAVLESLLVDSAAQIQRHKMTVHRDPKRLLRAAESVFAELRDSRAILEIAFEGEVGFGLGPTLEFYTLVSHQLMTAHLNLWHGHEFTSEGYFITPAPGLYPRPMGRNVRASQAREVRSRFFFVGQLMARALLDWRQLDISLSPALYKWFLYTVSPQEDLCLGGSRAGVSPADLALIDPQFARHYTYLMKLHRRRSRDASAVETIDSEIEDLCLNFTLPGYQIELCRNGAQVPVTGLNVGEYLHSCASWFLVEGVRRQITALLEGFDSVLPGVRTTQLAILFRPDECEGLFCGTAGGGGELYYRDQMAFIPTAPAGSAMTTPRLSSATSAAAAAAGWDVETLMQSCLCDHGYTLQSRTIQFLFEVMAEFDEATRRLFIQFVTGSPRLPIGGFRALKPPLKIVMKREAEERADHHLPSVMTCQNYLKLPNYSSKEIMHQKLLYAIREGQHAFHLS